MPISRAYKLCPSAFYLPVNFPLYTRASENVMRILRSYAEKFQQVSIDEAYFLSPLPVRKILGVGKKTEAELKNIGIETIGQLASYDIQKLLSRFGKWSVYLRNLANGIDDSEVREEEFFKIIF
jgi:nucleotidyltransferase/DNA polymerase involved in DNA repair